jgi:hypothetical protein
MANTEKIPLPCAYCTPPTFKGWHNGKCPYCGKTDPKTELKYGDHVNFPDGLGFVKEVEDHMVKCYIQSFGCRWYKLENVQIATIKKY